MSHAFRPALTSKEVLAAANAQLERDLLAPVVVSFVPQQLSPAAHRIVCRAMEAMVELEYKGTLTQHVACAFEVYIGDFRAQHRECTDEQVRTIFDPVRAALGKMGLGW